MGSNCFSGEFDSSLEHCWRVVHTAAAWTAFSLTKKENWNLGVSQAFLTPIEWATAYHIELWMAVSASLCHRSSVLQTKVELETGWTWFHFITLIYFKNKQCGTWHSAFYGVHMYFGDVSSVQLKMWVLWPTRCCVRGDQPMDQSYPNKCYNGPYLG